MDLTNYTSTDLLKMSNDIVIEHNNIKQNVVNDLLIIDEIQNKINKNLQSLDDLKNLNIIIIEELNKRQYVE
jgi:hypothetical protein